MDELDGGGVEGWMIKMTSFCRYSLHRVVGEGLKRDLVFTDGPGSIGLNKNSSLSLLLDI